MDGYDPSHEKQIEELLVQLYTKDRENGDLRLRLKERESVLAHISELQADLELLRDNFNWRIAELTQEVRDRLPEKRKMTIKRPLIAESKPKAKRTLLSQFLEDE